MENAVNVITIVVDPAFDLAQAGNCTCELCCERFFEAYCAAAELVAEIEEIEITVERGDYGLCGEQDDQSDIWQKIHDEVDWTDHDDLSEKHSVESWDTVATYIATFPAGNDPDGHCTVGVQIGQGNGGYWYMRTRDDAGGSDDDKVIHLMR